MESVNVSVRMTLEGKGRLVYDTVAESLRRIKPEELVFEGLEQEDGGYRAVLSYRRNHLS